MVKGLQLESIVILGFIGGLDILAVRFYYLTIF